MQGIQIQATFYRVPPFSIRRRLRGPVGTSPLQTQDDDSETTAMAHSEVSNHDEKENCGEVGHSVAGYDTMY